MTIIDPFSPIDWCHEFTSVGGSIVVGHDGQVSLGINLLDTTPEQQQAAMAMINALDPRRSARQRLIRWAQVRHRAPI